MTFLSDRPTPWSREYRCRCGALVARCFDGRTPEGRVVDMEGRMGTHGCRFDTPLPIDWHACRYCEHPVFEVASVSYDDVTARIKHECQQPQTQSPVEPSPIWQRFQE